MRLNRKANRSLGKVLDPSAGYKIKVSEKTITNFYETNPAKRYIKYLYVEAFDPAGKKVGSTEIDYNNPRFPDRMESFIVNVDPAHRRQGIASAMYKAAEAFAGKKMGPSARQTKEGQALWQGGSSQQAQFGAPPIRKKGMKIGSLLKRKSKGFGAAPDIKHVIDAVQKSLSPDLLKAKYRGGSHPHAGHCSVASEAIYFLLGGKRSGLTPMQVRVGDVSHWYLKDSAGNVVDPTAGQFACPVPYELGRGKGFPTPKRGLPEQPPSQRAKIVINRARALLGEDQ